MKNIIIVIVVLVTVNVFAGWGNWNATQKQDCQDWVATQGHHHTVRLRRAINRSVVIGTNEWPEVIDRNPFVVKAEKFAKAVAVNAGIASTDTMAQMDTKLRAMISNASTADKPIKIYEANAFWTAYFFVKTIEASGNATVTRHHVDPIYGTTPAEDMNLGLVTGDDIERAVRP